MDLAEFLEVRARKSTLVVGSGCCKCNSYDLLGVVNKVPIPRPKPQTTTARPDISNRAPGGPQGQGGSQQSNTNTQTSNSEQNVNFGILGIPLFNAGVSNKNSQTSSSTNLLQYLGPICGIGGISGVCEPGGGNYQEVDNGLGVNWDNQYYNQSGVSIPNENGESRFYFLANQPVSFTRARYSFKF